MGKRQVSLSLDDAMVDAVDQVARAEHRDRSGQVAFWIDQGLRRVTLPGQLYVPGCDPHADQPTQGSPA